MPTTIPAVSIEGLMRVLPWERQIISKLWKRATRNVGKATMRKGGQMQNVFCFDCNPAHNANERKLETIADVDKSTLNNISHRKLRTRHTTVYI